MGLFDKIFKKKKNIPQTESFNRANLPEKCKQLLELKDKIEDLLNSNVYVAKKDYVSVVKNYDKVLHGKSCSWCKRTVKINF